MTGATSASEPAGPLSSAVIVPLSAENLKATYDTLGQSCLTIEHDAKAILGTLQTIGEVLDTVKGASSFSGPWGGLGPIALPIPIAMKALMAPLSEYVKQRTGTSLYDWIDFVSNTRAQCDIFLGQLSRVAGFLERSAASTQVSATIGFEQLRADEEFLLDTKSKTRLWRPVLAQVARLGQVFDAMLESGRRLGNEERTGWTKSFLEGAAGKLRDQAANVRQLGEEIVLPAMAELKAAASKLHDQVEQFSRGVTELEDLLDLGVAQIRAQSGALSAEEADVLSKRVAAMVLVPRLASRIEKTRQTIATFEDYLTSLETAYQQAQIPEKVQVILAAEYQQGLDAAQSQLESLKTEAIPWQTTGSAMLDSGLTWLQDQIEIVHARHSVGQLSVVEERDRVEALEREIAQTNKAKRLVDDFAQL